MVTSLAHNAEGRGTYMDNKTLASKIDHTMLKPEATRDMIRQYCAEAKQHGFFSVCVNSCHAELVTKELEGSSVKTCCVVGFPLGAMSTSAKAYEAARAVKAVKTVHPNVRLILLMPYLNNVPLPEGFDGAIYPDGLEYVPKKYAIPRANQAMVDRCDYLIAHVKYPFGGAFQCLNYAKRKGIRIANIAK